MLLDDNNGLYICIEVFPFTLPLSTVLKLFLAETQET